MTNIIVIYIHKTVNYDFKFSIYFTPNLLKNSRNG